MEQIAAKLLQFLPFVLDVGLSEERLEQLITALADLIADIGKRELIAKVLEGFFPGLGVLIHRIEESAVNVEYHCFEHDRVA